MPHCILTLGISRKKLSSVRVKLHEPKCNARKCRHCSSSISKDCLIYHEYICAYKEEHRNGKILQQCSKCHGLFTQEQFKQHACKNYTDPQSQTDSIPNHSVSDTGVVVISPIAASDRYEIETNTEAETFIHALNKELPRAETNEKPVFRFKAEINAEPSMDEILKQEIKDTSSIKTGNIVEIKPKYEPEFTQVQTVQLTGPETGIIEPCNSETIPNVLVIKPEIDSANPELCKDVYFPNLKSESEAVWIQSSAGYVTEAIMDYTEPDNKSNVSDFLVKSEPENNAADVIKSEDNQCIPDLHGEKDNSLRSLEHESLMYNQEKPHSFTLDKKQSNLRKLPSCKMCHKVFAGRGNRYRKLHWSRKKRRNRNKNAWKRCLMCLLWFSAEELEKHLWKCRVKVPCLIRSDGLDMW